MINILIQDKSIISNKLFNILYTNEYIKSFSIDFDKGMN